MSARKFERIKTARGLVLFDGLIDWVSLAKVHSIVLEEGAERPLAEVRNETFSLVCSLLEDGLFEAGAVSRKQGFVAWDTTVAESIHRIHDVYVTHFDDDDWSYGVWLKLTDKGWLIARSFDGVVDAREDVLLDGLSGEVDLGAVHWYAKLDNPMAPLCGWQSETLSLVRSLANDGLAEVGDFSDKSGDFVAWDTPLDQSMQRIYKLYVTYFREGLGWRYEVWLKLTDKGEQLARLVEKKTAKGPAG